MKSNTHTDLLLACMPWATGHRPSIALGILRAMALENGLTVKSYYGNLDMAAEIGFDVAEQMADQRPLYGLSEHLFACDMFDPVSLGSDKLIEALRDVLEKDGKDDWCKTFADRGFIHNLRDVVVPGFLDRATAHVLEIAPKIVGFTGTFNQVFASLALAKRIKQARPDTIILCGGACFDDEMGKEYHRALPDVIDHVFIGEAETSFQEFMRRYKAGEPTRGIPGITSWVDGAIELVPVKPLQDMNQSPVPDYDDFFAETDRVEAETGRVFNIEYLPFESARGCWWGQKNHCVFCGINEELMPFRPKTVDRVLEDIVHLSARYGVVRFTATDWIISRWHCDELFRRIDDLDLDLDIFYEVRADMRKDQIFEMKKAGINRVQPGIESFSTPVLKLMRKGTTAIKHVQFIRWCQEIGVKPLYNILCGFPNEEPEWYGEMAELMPRLRHLEPPMNNVYPIEMHRFSPLFENLDKFGVEAHELRPDYSFNFPEGMADNEKIAYFFTFESHLIPKDKSYLQPVLDAIEPWIEAHKAQERPVYHYMVGAGFVLIHDTRHGLGRTFKLYDMHRDAVLLCDKLQTRAKLAEALQPIWGDQITDGTFDRVIAELLAADILMSEGEQLLTLPIGKRPRQTAQLEAIIFGTEAGEPAPELEGTPAVAIGT